MFFRRKSVGPRSYLQIVESRRTHGAVRQHVVATLGGAVGEVVGIWGWRNLRLV